MPARKKAGCRLTSTDYTRVYHCSINTVGNWRAAGAPLDDPRLLVHWLLVRKSNQPMPRLLRAYIRFGGGLAGVVETFNSLAAKSVG